MARELWVGLELGEGREGGRWQVHRVLPLELSKGRRLPTPVLTCDSDTGSRGGRVIMTPSQTDKHWCTDEPEEVVLIGQGGEGRWRQGQIWSWVFSWTRGQIWFKARRLGRNLLMIAKKVPLSRWMPEPGLPTWFVGPVQNENAGSFVQTLLRIPRQQQQKLQPSAGPIWLPRSHAHEPAWSWTFLGFKRVLIYLLSGKIDWCCSSSFPSHLQTLKIRKERCCSHLILSISLGY